MTKQSRLISYLWYVLFIMDLILGSVKPTTGQQITFKKHVTSMSCQMSLQYSHVALVSRYPFWQPSVDHNMMSMRMSTIKLTQIVYALDMWLVMSGHYKKIMPGHYKKTANQSMHIIVATYWFRLTPVHLIELPEAIWFRLIFNNNKME